MELKDLFKLALKLIAIFYAIEAIFIIGSNIRYFLYGYDLLNISSIWMFISTIVPVLMYYLIFVQSDKLIKFLKIDKGFTSQQVNFGNLSSGEILKISFIIFGLIMIVWGLPNFVTNCFYAFKYSAGNHLLSDSEALKYDYFEITQSGIYILLGYLMISNYKRIANWFDKQS
ncbi:hypothetical protein AAON49_10565 [Pseudotenacibaculum sp. MALMAid0570]|uniref:hypothetical protein n=1 Tax=Pseudotenacibaculum sp. MALMAid0570 TaxID=3143938 RepID=UPI0032E01D13